MSDKKRIFACTRPKNVKEWEDCKICLYAKCGFSLCFEPNPKWREQNGVCIYEHCIENSHLTLEEACCPIFGHGCPGGRKQLIRCKQGSVIIGQEVTRDELEKLDIRFHKQASLKDR